MTARNCIASFAMGVLMFSVLTARTMRAQQADDRNDPNLPGTTSPTSGVVTPSGVRVQWIKTDPSHPQVTISGPDVPYGSTQYFGWNDQGSYLRNNNNRQVYIWNLSKGSLTKLGPEIPPDTFASLRNNPNTAVAKNTPALPQQTDPHVDERNDLNLPGMTSPTGGVVTPSGVRIEWVKIDPEHPQVIFAAPGVRTDHPAQYLGWNDKGSYFRNLDDRQVYVWNLSKGTLTKIGPEVPPADFASFKNNSYKNSLAAAKKTTSAVTQADDKNDPNMPGPISPPGLKVQWTSSVPGYYDVVLADPNGPRSSHAAQYLGWNDQGSYLKNFDDAQVYVWNLQKNSLTKIGSEVPPADFASLKNNSYKNSLAAAKNAPPSPPKGPEPKTPDTSRQAAFFGNVGKLPQGTPQGVIAGTGATIQGGVLTFTRADNTKASYKVVRPKVMQSNPQAAGIAGTWIAMEAGGKGIVFTVQADGTLSGREMPAQLIQMLTQAPAR